ncbi:unnamed protein product [Callosobruchus maculatus]|uniref:Uncharacterized protein n=1 Tax=Callosobruchus maculatus TaxID=64391 RepID=A0A653D5Z9_CALMS|nr:unnamed protein product [Callosobruchus maculatus]
MLEGVIHVTQTVPKNSVRISSIKVSWICRCYLSRYSKRPVCQLPPEECPERKQWRQEHRMEEARPPNMSKWPTSSPSNQLREGQVYPRPNRGERVYRGRTKGDQASRDRLQLGVRSRGDVAEAPEKGPRGDAEVVVRRNKETVAMEQRSDYRCSLCILGCKCI